MNNNMWDLFDYRDISILGSSKYILIITKGVSDNFAGRLSKELQRFKSL